jgi:hypothetical protein
MALMTVITAYENALEGLRDTGSIPVPLKEISIVQVLERVGIDSWDETRRKVSA